MISEERILVTKLLADEPDLGVAVTWAKRLTRLLRQKATKSLDGVLAAGAGTLLCKFAGVCGVTTVPSMRRCHCHGPPARWKARLAGSR